MELSDLDTQILCEDDAFIVLDKPAGFVVNRSHTYTEPTVQEWMEKKLANSKKIVNEREPVKTEADDEENMYGTPEEIFARRSGVVHRLDKDTSGVLLLAKTPPVLIELMRQFRERETQKTYEALVQGKLVPREGIDRKSTRLNSSHTVISYAVFC